LEGVVFLLPAADISFPIAAASLLFVPIDLPTSPAISAMVSWGDGEELSTDFSSLGADASVHYFDF
jgi:hypothetical protein